MKKISALIFLVFVSNILFSQTYKEMIYSEDYSVQEIIGEATRYFKNRDKGKGSGYIQFKRWEYMATRLMNQQGFVSKTEERLEELRRYTAYLNTTSQNRTSLTDNWQELGPTYWNATSGWNPGVGRITGIAVDPVNNNHIIIGANTGGVWKTIDGGQTWLPLTDYFSQLGVFSVTIDPQSPNIYYFGSYSGLIFKSTDSGGTWDLLADLGTSVVNKISINPTNTDIIFASLATEGVKRSIDGGLTWQTAVSDNYGYDIEFKPDNPNVVYASGSGFHKSTDGGNTFTTISGFSNGPKMIGVSPDNPDIVYVLEASGGSFGGFYKSSDSGQTFSELDHSGRNYLGYDTNGYEAGGQAPRDMDIAVNPNNVDEVHIAGILTWMSLNGGVTFENTSDWTPDGATINNVGYCHADVDILVFSNNTLFAGTDGGIFKSENTTQINTNYYTDITTGIGIRQFYKIGISQTQDVIISGGSQDNGTSIYAQTFGWKDWLGADGMETFVDKFNTSRVYGSIYFGYFYGSSNGGNTYYSVHTPAQGTGNWVTPFEQDPIDSNVFYAGYNRVYKTTNGGSSWTTISQDLGDNVDELKIASSNNLIMYSSRDSYLYKTEDGGTTNWIQMTSPGGQINSIAIHPTNPNKIAVATTSNNKVFVSDDGGQTWQNYRFNLPNFSALSLVWDNNGKEGLYLGMNYGVYYIDNTFTEWQPYFNNLPNVIINELEINKEDGNLYAGTYGRGLWVSPLVPSVLGSQEFELTHTIRLYPNPVLDELIIFSPISIEGTISVFDMTGKLLKYLPAEKIEENLIINLSDLKAGVYFIKISSENGYLTKKFIKK